MSILRSRLQAPDGRNAAADVRATDAKENWMARQYSDIDHISNSLLASGNYLLLH
jgi:hypothetical protein